MRESQKGVWQRADVLGGTANDSDVGPRAAGAGPMARESVPGSSRLRAVVVLLATAVLALTLASSALAAAGHRDGRADAPRHARALAAAAAAGETTMTFDEGARRARLRIDAGYDLDQYRFADQSPITFQIDLEGLEPNPAGSQPVKLRMGVYDVDQTGGADCGPEVDKVSVNGKHVGNLSGADGQWSMNAFPVPAGALNRNSNAFSVAIDTGGTGCWAVSVGWAEVEVPFNIGQTAADATDDATIMRDKSTTVIPDRVWETAFDADGSLKPPTADDPVADAMNDSHWFSSDTAGKFTYKYTLDAWPNKPDWKPKVKSTYRFSGGAAETVPDAEGWDGKFEVKLPRKTGKYTLTVELEYARDGTKLRRDVLKHEVYVLFGEPRMPGVGPYSPSAPTDTPKTAWLDTAFAWGAAGHDKAEPILEALNNKIYSNPLGWVYAANLHDTPVALLEGTGKRGECTTFANVWEILAWSLGINVDEGYYPGFFGSSTAFLTTTKPALDGNASANVSRRGGVPRERWAFGVHVWGTYEGKRYDPTFGLIGPDTTADFKRDSVFCEYEPGVPGPSGSWTCKQIATPSSRVNVFELGIDNSAGWGLYEYEPAAAPPSPPPPRPFRAALARTIVSAVGPATETPVDADANGAYELLRVDVPVTVATAGTYVVRSTLDSPTGRRLSTGTLDPSVVSTSAVSATLQGGANTVPVYFRGSAIRAGGENGPYLADVRIFAADGSSVGDVQHTTSAYDHLSFQGALAVPGTVTDAAVDTDAVPGPDRLRVSVPLTVTAPGRVHLRAELFAGTTRLGDVERELDVTSSQTVDLDFPAEPIWSAGIDGPYTVRVTVEDALAGTRAEHTTAAYEADDFQPPKGYIARTVTDERRDLDGDGAADALAVTTSVAARAAGDYTLEGTLVAADGAVLGTARKSVAATPTSAPADLTFDAAAIVRRKADGPYDVLLSLTDGAGALQIARTHRTGAHRAADFQRPAASLTGSYTDAAVDTNGDGHPDVLRVETGVEVAQAGEYTLGGMLVDAGGRRVADATATADLPAGMGTLTLDFDGAAVQAGGRSGPYRLTGVELGSGGAMLDVALDAHTTQPYDASQFRPGGAYFVERITDRGIDDDGDGLFDRLAVDVTVRVHEPGSFAANGRLVDPEGDEIEWSGTEAYLDPGEHALTIEFEGRRISGQALDGPYRVEDLSVYTDPERPITIRTPHATAAYRWQDFELGAVILGHVSSGGQPVEGAVIAVSGRAYDSTDATGAYRLALPGGGAHQVGITADPALAPWRITRDGQTLAVGTSADVALTDGETATVDFASVPPDNTPPVTTGERTPPANVAGWNTGDVQVRLSAADEAGGSGVQEITYRVEHGGTVIDEQTVPGGEATIPVALAGITTITYHARDMAGNVAAESTEVVRIDRAAPSIAVTAPADGAVYAPGQAVTAGYACTDDASGVAACTADVASGQPLDTTTPGDRTFTIRARDQAGNEVSHQVRWSVAKPVKLRASLEAKRRQRIGTVVRDGIAAGCRANMSAKCTATAAIRARDARRLGLTVPPGTRRFQIGNAGPVSVNADRSAPLTIRPDARVRKALRRVRRLRVTLTAKLVDNGGHRATAKRRIVLLRR
jgi:hypothetical protein